MEIYIYILLGIFFGITVALFFVLIRNNNKKNTNNINEINIEEIKDLVKNIAVSTDTLKSTFVGSMQYRGRITEIGLRKHFESWGWIENKNFYERKGFINVGIGFITARTTMGCALLIPPSIPPALFEYL